MKQKLTLLAMALIAVFTARAQMIAYDVQTTTTDYEDVTGGTVIDLQGTTGKDLAKLMIDADGNLNFNNAEEVTAFPIGFDFAYNSKQMKYFLIGSDGEILLSTEETVTTNLHQNTNTMFSNNTFHDAFGVVVRNGVYGYDDTEISYKLEGEEGSRVLIIQYKNIGLQTNSNWQKDDYAKVNIQYRLFEATGNVEMKVSGFKPYDGVESRNHFMRIGLLGDPQDRLLVYDYNGTEFGSKDNFITYSADSYPADGTTYTFVAPEPCETPATAPTELALTSTSTQISGTFTVGAADYYLVLATTDNELTEAPADHTKYVLSQVVGNATVIAVVEAGEFTSPQTFADLMTPGVKYTVFVYGYNSKCANGPLYNATPAKASIATKPEAPEAITVSNVDKNTLQLNVKPAGSAPVLVAMTTEQYVNTSNQYLTYGIFGQPAGTYNVGDEIEGGGKVVFAGSAAGEITQVMEDLGLDNGADLTKVNVEGGVTLTFDKNTGSNQPKYYDSGKNARVYTNNTLTIASEKTITKVVMTTTKSEQGGNIVATTAEGTEATVTKGTETVTITDINSKSLTILNGKEDGNSTQLRIVSLTVYTEAEPIALELEGLEAGTPYFFRAWSADGEGAYSTLYVDASDVTAAELPWELTIDETLVTGSDYLGWKSDDNATGGWADNSRSGYIYNQINSVDAENGAEAWYESPYIYLSEGTNRIKTTIAGTQRSGWMQGAWTLADGDEVKFQVTKDGTEYKDILVINKDNCESLANADFKPFEATFSDYAGEKVRLRIYIKRFSMGQTQFGRLLIEEKPAVDYPANIRVAAAEGNSVTIEWDAEENATSYDVSYKPASDAEWSEPQTVTETSITLDNLLGLATYEVRVRSNSATSASGWSDVFSFTTGASVPFEFVVADADDLNIWTAYSGELTENTELAEGGDFLVMQRSGFGGMMLKYIYFTPSGTTSNSWLVSPAIGLGTDATKKLQATLSLNAMELGESDSFTLKVVVANDGENFSSANVIGTIEKSELEEGTDKDFTFDFTGFSGSIRLGYYIEASNEDGLATYLNFLKMGLLVDDTAVGIQQNVTTQQPANAIFNLQGQRISKAQKGLNIVDGKKFIVK